MPGELLAEPKATTSDDPSADASPIAADPWPDRSTIGLFGLFLGLPLVGFLFGSPQPPHENRPRSPAPALVAQRWAVQSFPPMFDAYFADRLGGRTELLAVRRSVVESLGDSPSPLVWIGPDDTLFVNVETAIPSTDPDAGARAWAAEFQHRQATLAADGIQYVVLIAPEKSTVRMNLLPDAVRRHPPADVSGVVRRYAGRVPIVELGSVMKDSSDPLYYARDSHWTDFGAMLAYHELAKSIPDLKPGVAAEFEPGTYAVCDLAKALGRPEADWSEEATQFVEPRRVREVPSVEGPVPEPLPHVPTRVTESDRGPRVVLLHDSFGVAFRRIMAGDCRRLVAVGTYGLPEELIARERPNVVVQLLVERVLRRPPGTP